MKFSVNISALADSFPLPKTVAQRFLKLATEKQLKVLINVMYNLSGGIDAEKTAAELGFSSSDVEDALVFWAQSGVLKGEEAPEKKEKDVVINSGEPSRIDVIRRGLEDKNLAFLLREAQLKFGRSLKQNESGLLVSLYDDNDMDVSVILLLLQYAKSMDKLNKTFIEKTAALWLKNGVETVADAEAAIAKTARDELAWGIVCRAFGLEKRRPSEKESAAVSVWINEWKLTEETLRSAYDVCVNAKSKFSFAYTASVLESWHKKGVKNEQEAKEVFKKNQDGNSKRSYDIELFEKMLNED